MNGKPWTDKEIEMIKMGMSIKHIAELTGRTINAVAHMKSRIKHGYILSEVEPVKITPLCQILTQAEKERRLEILMKQYGVRLG